jgi:2-oxopent-4-enoate hydratase
MELTLTERHEHLARALHEAERTRTPIAPLSEQHPDLTLDDAYAIQRAGRHRREAAGARLAGHKIGLTSQAMQEMLGVDQPDFGVLLEDMLLPSGAELSTGDLIAPRVEAEIAFRLAAPLNGTVSRDDVLGATEAVAPALEVIDSRIADWRITIVDTVADNASSARVVLGAFRPLGDLDLASVEMRLDVTAPAETVTGRGDVVLGHPAEAIAWLAAALHRYGEGLAAGEVVIPGALSRALPVAPTSEAHASLTGLGEVHARFTP